MFDYEKRSDEPKREQYAVQLTEFIKKIRNLPFSHFHYFVLHTVLSIFNSINFLF